MKEGIISSIENQLPKLWSIATNIYDHPEKGFQEYFAQNALCTYLEENGFAVERGVGGVETAFRAVYNRGEGGPSIGLYCEYDCLPSGVHACGHHLQGPSAIGAAVAVKNSVDEDAPFTLTVYGTPAEEGGGGKIIMIENGCFRELDVIFGNHAGAETTTDPRTYDARSFDVTFFGKSAHVQAAPEEVRDPMDALLLAMEGMEYMREHVIDGCRIHYKPLDDGMTGVPSTSPKLAKGTFNLRCFSNAYMSESMEPRFFKIIEGAAKMTGTTYKIERHLEYCAKFPIPTLIDLFYKSAAEAGCQRIDPPRKKVGSSDFGNIMQVIPGVGIRVEFAPKGTSAHSKEWAAIGKAPEANNYVRLSARTLAFMCVDIIRNADEILPRVRQEYSDEKEKSNRG